MSSCAAAVAAERLMSGILPGILQWAEKRKIYLTNTYIVGSVCYVLYILCVCVCVCVCVSSFYLMLSKSSKIWASIKTDPAEKTHLSPMCISETCFDQSDRVLTNV